MTTSRKATGTDVWPPAPVRVALPFTALAVLVATLAVCFHVSGGRRRWGSDLPVISSLGRDMPEHAWFATGFTVLAALMAIMFRARTRMLKLDPEVRARPGLRVAIHACSGLAVLSMGSMLAMAWIPDSASPLHFFAALATFGALALYELIHAFLCVAVARASQSPGALVRAWLFVCPFLAMACVHRWVSEGSVPAQYMAVAMQFAYFLPLARAFGQEPEAMRGPVATR